MKNGLTFLAGLGLIFVSAQSFAASTVTYQGTQNNQSCSLVLNLDDSGKLVSMQADGPGKAYSLETGTPADGTVQHLTFKLAEDQAIGFVDDFLPTFGLADYVILKRVPLGAAVKVGLLPAAITDVVSVSTNEDLNKTPQTISNLVVSDTVRGVAMKLQSNEVDCSSLTRTP